MARAIKRCVKCLEQGKSTVLYCLGCLNGKKTYICRRCGMMVDIDARKRKITKIYWRDNDKISKS